MKQLLSILMLLVVLVSCKPIEHINKMDKLQPNIKYYYRFRLPELATPRAFEVEHPVLAIILFALFFFLIYCAGILIALKTYKP